MHGISKPRITELNPHLMCVLCGGYFIDATAIIECLHAFCKTCIVKYLETHKYCPICDVLVHKTKPLQNIRPDHTLQNIVYKLVPELYNNEMNSRRIFYSKVSYKLRPADPEMRGEITNQSHFFTSDETINIKLEYANNLGDQIFVSSLCKKYLRCPAAVKIGFLRKLIFFKYHLSADHDVIFLWNGIQLPEHLTFMDVAYISEWKRKTAISLMYQILKPHRKIITFEDDYLKNDKPEKVEKSSNTDNTNMYCSLSPNIISYFNNNNNNNDKATCKLEIIEANNNNLLAQPDVTGSEMNYNGIPAVVANCLPSNKQLLHATTSSINSQTINSFLKSKQSAKEDKTSAIATGQRALSTPSVVLSDSGTQTTQTSDLSTSCVASYGSVLISSQSATTDGGADQKVAATSNTLLTDSSTDSTSFTSTTSISQHATGNKNSVNENCQMEEVIETEFKTEKSCDTSKDHFSSPVTVALATNNVEVKPGNAGNGPEPSEEKAAAINSDETSTPARSEQKTSAYVESAPAAKKPRLDFDNATNDTVVVGTSGASTSVSTSALASTSTSTSTLVSAATGVPTNSVEQIKNDGGLPPKIGTTTAPSNHRPSSTSANVVPNTAGGDYNNYDVNTIAQVYKDKMLKSSSKSWNNNATKKPDQEEPIEIVKSSSKVRNIPRYLGNPSSGIKPMYLVSSGGGANNGLENKSNGGAGNDNSFNKIATNSSSGKGKAAKEKSKKQINSAVLSLQKIDPKTLCPIVTSSANSSTSSVTTSANSFTAGNLCSNKKLPPYPLPSTLFNNAKHPVTINHRPYGDLSKAAPPPAAHLNPFAAMAAHHNHPLLGSINPLLYGIYPSFQCTDGTLPTASSLQFMKAMSNLYPNAAAGAFHPSLPSVLFNAHARHNSSGNNNNNNNGNNNNNNNHVKTATTFDRPRTAEILKLANATVGAGKKNPDAAQTNSQKKSLLTQAIKNKITGSPSVAAVPTSNNFVNSKSNDDSVERSSAEILTNVNSTASSCAGSVTTSQVSSAKPRKAGALENSSFALNNILSYSLPSHLTGAKRRKLPSNESKSNCTGQSEVVGSNMSISKSAIGRVLDVTSVEQPADRPSNKVERGGLGRDSKSLKCKAERVEQRPNQKSGKLTSDVNAMKKKDGSANVTANEKNNKVKEDSTGAGINNDTGNSVNGGKDAHEQSAKKDTVITEKLNVT